MSGANICTCICRNTSHHTFCTHVCAHVCTHICTHVCTHVDTHTCIHAHVYSHACPHIGTCICTCKCTCLLHKSVWHLKIEVLPHPSMPIPSNIICNPHQSKFTHAHTWRHSTYDGILHGAMAHMMGFYMVLWHI